MMMTGNSFDHIDIHYIVGLNNNNISIQTRPTCWPPPPPLHASGCIDAVCRGLLRWCGYGGLLYGAGPRARCSIFSLGSAGTKLAVLHRHSPGEKASECGGPHTPPLITLPTNYYSLLSTGPSLKIIILFNAHTHIVIYLLYNINIIFFRGEKYNKWINE